MDRHCSLEALVQYLLAQAAAGVENDVVILSRPLTLEEFSALRTKFETAAGGKITVSYITCSNEEGDTLGFTFFPVSQQTSRPLWLQEE